ncbi:MAG: ribbon-helix-helix protein, CopG family [Lachnospiraceae bacterium]|nr:ribbon-helix-helix protein, CopG family [Lachnospiraceae bacterium]
MPMERFTVTMSESDIDNFERERAKQGMSKSAFIRFLMVEHENTVPSFLKNKEVVTVVSELNNTIKTLLLQNTLSDADKLKVFEEIKMTNVWIEKLCAKMT